MKHQHKKCFGQNFLIDGHIIEQIIGIISPKKNDNILEIGIGMGALTMPLLARVNQLNVVELDRELIQHWQNKNLDKLQLYQSDILKFNLKTLKQPLRVVGNLPYNISSPILMKMIENRYLIQDMCFMFQQEVAKRITANPNNKIYGRLSVIMQYYFHTNYCFDVPNTAFEPMPKVQSAIIVFIPKQKTTPIKDQNFNYIVKQSFSMRRKTLKNCLKSYLKQSQTVIDLSRRAETLNMNEFIQLTQDYERQK